MLASKMWTISKHSSIKEDNHSNKWIIKTWQAPVIEMEQAPLASTQVVLEATELELQTALPNLIRLIYLTW